MSSERIPFVAVGDGEAPKRREFTRWWAVYTAEKQAEALEAFAHRLEREANWIENKFIPGPHVTPVVESNREKAEELRAEAQCLREQATNQQNGSER